MTVSIERLGLDAVDLPMWDALGARTAGQRDETVAAGDQLARRGARRDDRRAGTARRRRDLASSRAGIPGAEHAAAARLMPDLMPIMSSDDVREGQRAFVERRAGELEGA